MNIIVMYIIQNMINNNKNKISLYKIQLLFNYCRCRLINDYMLDDVVNTQIVDIMVALQDTDLFIVTGLDDPSGNIYLEFRNKIGDATIASFEDELTLSDKQILDELISKTNIDI